MRMVPAYHGRPSLPSLEERTGRITVLEPPDRAHCRCLNVLNMSNNRSDPTANAVPAELTGLGEGTNPDGGKDPHQPLHRLLVAVAKQFCAARGPYALLTNIPDRLQIG